MLMVISGYTVSSKSAQAIMRSQKMGGGGIEIIIATYTKVSHGVIQCLIFCGHLLPWVEKRVLYQLLPGNGLHSEQRNQAPYVGDTERESLRFSSSGRRKEAAAASASKWLHACQDSWATSFVLGGTGAYQKAWMGTGEASNQCAYHGHRKDRDIPASQLTRTDHTIPAV